MTWKKGAFCIALLLFSVCFISNAHALKFTGNGWVAQHIEGGNPTDEYFLVLEKSSTLGKLIKAKLKGFALKNPESSPDFYHLTGKSGSEGLDFLQIDTDKKKFRKWKKKANRKSNKKIKKGLLGEADKEEWVDEWITGKLKNKLFKIRLKNAAGQKISGKLTFATFENPVDLSDIGSIVDKDLPGDDTTSVPEPATMFLLGGGLLGLALFQRRFK